MQKHIIFISVDMCVGVCLFAVGGISHRRWKKTEESTGAGITGNYVQSEAEDAGK